MNALQFEIEVIACPLCGTRDHERPFLDEDLGTRFVRCERCCSVYLNPRPGAASRDAYYLQTEKHIQSQLRVAESRRPAFELISKVVRDHKPGGSLLLELGGDQAKPIGALLRELGFGTVDVMSDEDGDTRAISATLRE